MLYLKKLLLVPIFLALLFATLYLVKPLLTLDLLFSLTNKSMLVDLGIFTVSLLATSTIFIVFASLAKDWKAVIPTILLATPLPFLLFDQNVAQVFSPAIAVALFLTYTSLSSRLPEYLLLKTSSGSVLTFAPAIFISSSVKSLLTFLIIALSLGYYVLINQQIQQKGFSIPDSLLEQSIKFTMPSPDPEMIPKVKGIKFLAQVPQITPEQIEFLKQNKSLLESSGIDPSVLDSIGNGSKPSTTSGTQKVLKPGAGTLKPMTFAPIDTTELTKNLLKSQFDKMLKPFLWLIPIIAALVFFSELQFFATIAGMFLVSPLLWIIYFVLEQLDYIKTEKESSEIKKMEI